MAGIGTTPRACVGGGAAEQEPAGQPTRLPYHSRGPDRWTTDQLRSIAVERPEGASAEDACSSRFPSESSVAEGMTSSRSGRPEAMVRTIWWLSSLGNEPTLTGPRAALMRRRPRLLTTTLSQSGRENNSLLMRPTSGGKWSTRSAASAWRSRDCGHQPPSTFPGGPDGLSSSRSGIRAGISVGATGVLGDVGMTPTLRAALENSASSLGS